MLQKGYLRDASSFYGDLDLRNQYHLPGDAKLRAFGNQNFVGVEGILADSFEQFVYKKIGPLTAEVAFFIDSGILFGSKFEPNDQLFDNTTLIDYGFGLRLSTNIFGQPLYLRIDKPFDATIDGYSVENMNEWVFSFQKAI